MQDSTRLRVTQNVLRHIAAGRIFYVDIKALSLDI